MKWSEVEWSEVKWSEVKWSEVKSKEIDFLEVIENDKLLKSRTEPEPVRDFNELAVLIITSTKQKKAPSVGIVCCWYMSVFG